MKKNTFFLVLPLLLTVLLLGGCGKEEQILLNDSLTGVYRETVIPLPENYTVSDGLSFRDGRFSAPLYFTDDGGQTSYVTKNRQTISFDPDGGNVLVEPFEGFATSTETWDVGDTQFVSDDRFALTMSTNGQAIDTVDLPGLFDYNMEAALKNQQVEPVSFRVLNIVESNNFYYILTTEGLCSVAPDGSIPWTQTAGGDPTDIIVTDAGLLYLAGKPGEKTLRKVSEADGSLGDPIEMPDYIRGGGGIGMSQAGITFYPGDEAFDFYAATNLALWGITVNVGEEEELSCTAAECVNWLNSDIASTSFWELCLASDTVLTAIREIDGVNCLVLLTKVPEEELAARKILTLADFTDGTLFSLQKKAVTQAIEKFNRTNEEYRIVVTDFGIYDEEMRMTFFNAEMSAGRVPDIVILPQNGPNDSTADTYERSGIFTDLLPLMRADTAFDDEDLLGYATKPYLREGKQYLFPLMPPTRTQFGSSEFFDGPMTAEEVFAARDALPEGTYWTDRGVGFKSEMLDGVLYDFIDFDSATCSFDDGRLAEILTKFQSIENYPLPDELRMPENAIRDGRLRLMDHNAYSLFWFFKMQVSTGGVVAVGYPNRQKLLHTVRDYDVYFTVTEACEDKAAAFGLLNEILAAYEDMNPDGHTVFFESDVRRQFEQYADKTFVMEGNQFTAYDDGDEKLNGAKGIKMTEADAQAYIDYLNSIDALLPTNTAIYTIYDEECWSQLPRTPEEIADIIQSRVSILLSESYS